jgi:outer membrane protein TolC
MAIIIRAAPLRLSSSFAACVRPILAAWTLGWLSFACQQAFASALSFDQALDLAEQRAPALAAREAAIQSAQQARLTAGQLPNPKLSVGIDNFPVAGPDRFSVSRDLMTMRRLGVIQDVPNRAKREAQREGADARTEREIVTRTAEHLTVRRETAIAWIALHYSERKLFLFADLERENRILQDTVAARVASGKAMPADATMARQEALLLEDRKDELQAAVEQNGAAVNRFTGETSQAQTTGQPPVIAVDTGSLLARIDRHAELVAFAPMQAMAQADVQEAEAGKRGDWGWEVNYGNRSRAYGDMVSFALTFELPLFAQTRLDPQIASRRKEVDRIAAEREDALRRVTAEVTSQVAELRRLDRALERQRTTAMSLADERVRLTLSSYEAGRTELAAVLAARRDAAETGLRLLDLESQVMSQRARLAYLIAE